jgi:hypothetical protein
VGNDDDKLLEGVLSTDNGKSLADAFKSRLGAGGKRNSLNIGTPKGLGSPAKATTTKSAAKKKPTLLKGKAKESSSQLMDESLLNESKSLNNNANRSKKDILAIRKEMMKSKVKTKVDNFQVEKTAA